MFAADKDTGTISGFVMVESGSGNPKPVAGAEVRITFGSKSDSRKTGADGKYSFPELLPGKYTVKVIAPDDTKTKGDGTTAVTLVGGETERADFVLISTAKPTPTATSTPKASPSPTASPKPVVGQNNAAPGSSALMPALVVPYASPVTSSSQARTNQQNAGPASLSSSIGASASPSTVANGTPGPSLIFATGSPDAAGRHARHPDARAGRGRAGEHPAAPPHHQLRGAERHRQRQRPPPSSRAGPRRPRWCSACRSGPRSTERRSRW